MTKTKTKDEQAQQQGSSGLWVILAIVIGIATLVGLYSYSKMLANEQPAEAKELPLVSIMIEVNQFDQAARTQVVALEKALHDTGVFGPPQGPAEAKVVIPGAKPNDTPTVKGFEACTDVEWQAAWKYLQLTEYMVPRMFRIDGAACVIRADPKGGQGFAPDAGPKLLEVCDRFRGQFKTLRVYSRSLGVGTAQDRDALNASFGCQLSWIGMQEPNIQGSANGLTWKTAGALAKLAKAKTVLKTNPHFRRVSTDANWVTHYWTVKLQQEKEVALPSKDSEAQEAFDFAQANGLIVLQSKDGKLALVDTSTDSEGQDNAQLIYDMAANLQVELKVECVHNYHPKIVKPFKGEMTPDTPR